MASKNTPTFAAGTGRRTGACEVRPVAAVDYKHASFMTAVGVEGVNGAPNRSKLLKDGLSMLGVR